MSIKALSNYTFYSRYARFNPEKKRRESWEEAVARVFDMHRKKYADQIKNNSELEELISFAQSMQSKKRVLAAQRSLQFAGDPIFKHELKMFNCLFTHIDRPRVFQEIMYSLLCGCGVGFSVQQQHVNLLPLIHRRQHPVADTYIVEDSIEGWADAVGVLMDSYFAVNEWNSNYHLRDVNFDFSKIRPEGTLIAGQFKAPGPDGLSKALEKVRVLINDRINSHEFTTDKFANKLRPIDCYDIIMHISDAVLSGGVRRSATLCLFSHDDDEMLNAKIGNWFINNPQRGRSNNSAALLKGHVSREEFAKLMKSTKEFGEPGFIWMDDLDIGYNPCITGDAIIKVKDHAISQGGKIISEGVEYEIPLKLYVDNYISAEESPLILSHNIESGKDEYRQVTGAMLTRINAEIVTIELEDGKEIKCTPDHKIFTLNRGYVEAKDLTKDDEIKII
jgi:ribonucleoside-diphosphate reductase alpha chain